MSLREASRYIAKDVAMNEHYPISLERELTRYKMAVTFLISAGRLTLDDWQQGMDLAIASDERDQILAVASES